MPKKLSRKAAEYFLSAELPELRTQAVIPEEHLAALEQYYRERAAQPGSAGKIVTVIFYCIGALFVMLGISLIIAHNWDDFPDRVRLAMGFAPLAAGALFGAFTLWKAKSAAWRESAAIIYGIGIATALAVTTQVYYLGGELRSFLLVWLCLLIPVPFLFRSFGALVLTLAVTAAWNCSDFRTPQLWLHAALPLVPGAALAALLWDKKATGVWCRYLPGPFVLLYCVPFFCRGEAAALGLWLAAAGALCVAGCRIDETCFSFRNPVPAAGFAGGYFVLMYLCIRQSPSSLPGSPVLLPCCAAMLLMLAVIFVCAWKKPRKSAYLFALLPCAAWMLSFSFCWSCYVMTGVTLVLMTAFFITGVKQNSLTCINAALALIIGLIFVWFLESDVSILARGISFIIAGLIFVTVNAVMLKRRKKGGTLHA